MNEDNHSSLTERSLPTGLVVSETRQVISPWVSLVARDILKPGWTESQTFHSVAQADYVSVLAITRDGRLPLVRQYRPAVDAWTLELPAGLLDPGESPPVTASRELYEETGFRPAGPLTELGRLMPDSGRLGNAEWCFSATLENERDPAWRGEAGVECLLVSRRELKEMVLDGRFAHALHIAVVALAILRGTFTWDHA